MNKPNIRTYIFAFLFLPTAFLLNACSNDSSTTSPINNTGGDSLIFSKDSLVAYSDSTISNAGFSYTNDSCTWNKFKFSFTGETNDTSNSYIDLIISDGDTTIYYTYYKEHNGINGSFNESCNVTRNSNLRLRMTFVENYNIIPVGQHKLIRVRNFKFYRVN